MSVAARPISRFCRRRSWTAASIWGSRSTVTVTACSQSTRTGAAIDGDQIIAILALDQEVDQVAVTVMTNLGFHALMREHGIRVVTTDVGDRYVLEALHREGALLGGEQSGHVIYLRDHVTGDGLAAGLLLCAALKGRRLSVVAAAMSRFPQVKENVRVDNRELTPAILEEVERLNREWDGAGRVFVRPSGTEPLIRVLAEAQNADLATEACASIAALVRRELGCTVSKLERAHSRASAFPGTFSGASSGDKGRIGREAPDVRDHRICRESGLEAAAPCGTSAPRVPRVRLRRHRAPRG